MKDKLQLKGIEYSLQEWIKCKNIIQIKPVGNKNIKNITTHIIRSPKRYSIF